jgi:hypothetical protein
MQQEITPLVKRAHARMDLSMKASATSTDHVRAALNKFNAPEWEREAVFTFSASGESQVIDT